MNFDLDTGTALLARTPHALRALLADLPAEWVDATEGPGTWSPRVVVGHLVDAERVNWIPRAAIILGRGADRRFTPFDRLTEFPADTTLGDLLDEFARRRAESLATLASWRLTDAELALEGEHPEFGTVTLRQLLATWVTHDLAHTVQITRTMAKQYREAVGPWRAYLSVLNGASSVERRA